MSLLEALLLDPLRMNVWVAARTDGIVGTGTHNDPYDGSTAAKFDSLMSGLSANTCVHLGPGTFQTNGYYDGVVSGGWQPKRAMKITGSGIDVTVLQLTGSASNAHYYAIGHQLSVSGQPNLMDFFEISELTIDCNLAGLSGTGVACGAVRVMGNHSKIRHVKAINWGTKVTSRPCFVLATITADPPSGVNSVEDCGIDECLVMNPAAGNQGPANLLHAGGIETAGTNVLGLGIGPFIRNCFADAGASNPFTPEIRGLSMAWCKAGVVEGNQVHNMAYGVFQQRASAQDIVVRNNWFKNVNKGVLLGSTGVSSGSGSLTKSGSIAMVTIASGHNLSIGEIALLNTTGAYNGALVTVLSNSFTTTTFQFNTSNSAGADTVNSVQKVFGTTNPFIEGNVVELASATSGDLVGIQLQDGVTTGTRQDAKYPAYSFVKAVVRDNKVRYVDGVFDPLQNYVGYGINIQSAQNLLVRNNVIESKPANPVRNYRCGSVDYFNNQGPGGDLILGFNADTGGYYEELSTEADFASVMALMNRK
jgi:hypothetical protein